MEQQIAEEAATLLNISHAIFMALGAGGAGGLAGIIYKFTKKDLREGLMTKEDVKELLADIEEELDELKTSNDQRKENERDLYEKHRGISERVGFIEGKLS